MTKSGTSRGRRSGLNKSFSKGRTSTREPYQYYDSDDDEYSSDDDDQSGHDSNYHPRRKLRSDRDTETAKSLQSWILGILNGGQESWLKSYVESYWFNVAQRKLKSMTGFDLQWILTLYTVIQTVKLRLPAILLVLKHCSLYLTSSVKIRAQEEPYTCQSIQRNLSKSIDAKETSWLTFKGQHNQLQNDMQYEATDRSRHCIRHNNRLIMIDIDCEIGSDDSELFGSGTMMLRCLGHSDEPIRKYIEYCIKEEQKNGWMSLVTYAGSTDLEKITQVHRRPLATIDLEPEMMAEIRHDVESYFHESSQQYYQEAGTPLRRGYLLYGPPGTGKTSLCAALATHMEVPLVVFKLDGMDDNELEEKFQCIPYRCVVVFEDIDSAGIVRDSAQAKPGDGLGEQQEPARESSMKNDFTQKDSQIAIDAALTKQHKETAAKRAEIHGPNDDELNDEQSSTASDANDHAALENESETKPSVPKRITLSGILNVIDGIGAPEGRLLVMTTNAPKSLDKALYRTGRIDKQFYLGYSNKVIAERTFLRMFSSDPLRELTEAAIQRCAKAFKDQFPSKSRITPSDLSEFCKSYRGRPDKAVLEFPTWLKKFRTGQDAFAYDINSVSDDTDDGVNIEEPFDLNLIRLGKSDWIQDAKIDGIPDNLEEPLVNPPRSWLSKLLWGQDLLQDINLVGTETGSSKGWQCGEQSLPELRPVSPRVDVKFDDEDETLTLIHEDPLLTEDDRRTLGQDAGWDFDVFSWHCRAFVL